MQTNQVTKLVAYSLSYECTQDAGIADGSHRGLTCGECLFGVGAHFQAFQPHLEIALKSEENIFVFLRYRYIEPYKSWP